MTIASQFSNKGESMARPQLWLTTLSREINGSVLTTTIVDTSECFDGMVIEVASEFNGDFKDLGLWPFRKELLGSSQVRGVLFYRLTNT